MRDQPTLTASRKSAEDHLEAFESACALYGLQEVADHLPERDHPEYRTIFGELIRIHMEYSFDAGAPCRLADYAARFPGLADDPVILGDVAFEEFRLRTQRGERVDPAEYADRYGVLTTGWPTPSETHLVESPCAPSEATLNLETHEISAAGDSGRAAAQVGERIVDDPLADLAAMPEVGETFHGFTILAELGRGSYGRVYLALQEELASRKVVLKITRARQAASSAPARQGEPTILARLQHPNIVPIYMAFREGDFDAICMPYRGSYTLAELLKNLQGVPSWPWERSALEETLFIAGVSTRSPTGSHASRPHSAEAAAPRPAPSGELPDDLEAVCAALEARGRGDYARAAVLFAHDIAAGLEHAHSRRILHRDLKPANVLIAEDGAPMLIDFNLAEDQSDYAGRARAGGTPAYMAPEQLAAIVHGTGAVDRRIDLYALGVILFEMLTGKYPFPNHPGRFGDIAAEMLRDRLGAVPRLRPLNPRVSPGLEAIVRKCLAPAPDDRYPDAAALRRDLAHHLADEPLERVRVPSVRERLRKWCRRHPKWVSNLAIVLATLPAVVPITYGLVHERIKSAELEAGRATREALDGAREAKRRFLGDAPAIQYWLSFRGDELDAAASGRAMARHHLEVYGIPDADDRQALPAYAALPPEERAAVDAQLLDTILLLAHDAAKRGDAAAGDREWVARIHDRLPSTFPDGIPEVARALLARHLGAAAVPLPEAKTAREHYWVGRALVRDGRWADAAAALRCATQLDPKRPEAWFLLANCLGFQGDQTRMEKAYAVAAALSNDMPLVRFDRGIWRYRSGQFALAIDDFKAVAAARGDWWEARFNLAISNQQAGFAAEALAALEPISGVIRGSPTRTRIWLLRSRLLDELKRPEEAEAVRRAALADANEPADELDWTARAMLKIGRKDLQGAKADLERALRRNPRCYEALIDLAHFNEVYEKDLGAAVETTGRLAAAYPNHGPARSTHGVYLARRAARDDSAADHERAVAEAGAALELTKDRRIVYQVAAIHAVLGRRDKASLKTAYSLLAKSLLRGCAVDVVDADPDWDRLREEPTFVELIRAARTLTDSAN